MNNQELVNQIEKVLPTTLDWGTEMVCIEDGVVYLNDEEVQNIEDAMTIIEEALDFARQSSNYIFIYNHYK